MLLRFEQELCHHKKGEDEEINNTGERITIEFITTFLLLSGIQHHQKVKFTKYIGKNSITETKATSIFQHMVAK